MLPCTLLLSAVVGAVPAVYDIDCASLPPVTVADYNFKLTVRLSGQPPIESTIRAFKAATSSDVAAAIITTLGEPEWQVERIGTRVRVIGCGKTRVSGVAVTGDGPKPVVRWVPLLPGKK